MSRDVLGSVRLSEHSLVSMYHRLQFRMLQTVLGPQPRREPPDGCYGRAMLDGAAESTFIFSSSSPCILDGSPEVQRRPLHSSC